MMAQEFGLAEFVRKMSEMYRGKAYLTTPHAGPAPGARLHAVQVEDDPLAPLAT
jgi:hypothetical protein